MDKETRLLLPSDTVPCCNLQFSWQPAVDKNCLLISSLSKTFHPGSSFENRSNLQVAVSLKFMLSPLTC